MKEGIGFVLSSNSPLKMFYQKINGWVPNWNMWYIEHYFTVIILMNKATVGNIND